MIPVFRGITRYLGILLLATSLPGQNDWPQFRGPDRTGIVDWKGTIGEDEPKLAWSRDLGSGFAGPVIFESKVFIFHRKEDLCLVECLESTDGTLLWSQSWPTDYEDDFGFDNGPRASPVVTTDSVILHGAEGKLTCLERLTGKLRWQIDTVKEFGSQKGFFGRACQPLIDDGKVILHAGGEGEARGIVALDAKTGQTLWTAANTEAGYSSPLAGTWNGKPAIITFTREGVLVLDKTNGKTTFEKSHRAGMNASVNAALPVPCGPDRWFFTSSYGTGGLMLDSSQSATNPATVWANDTSLSAHYATPVYHDGHLYGFHGRQETGQEFHCVDASNGKVVWTSGPVDAGSVIGVNRTLLLLTERGELILFNASPDTKEPIARFQVARAETRAPAAFSNGLFLLRDTQSLRVWKLAQP